MCITLNIPNNANNSYRASGVKYYFYEHFKKKYEVYWNYLRLFQIFFLCLTRKTAFPEMIPNLKARFLNTRLNLREMRLTRAPSTGFYKCHWQRGQKRDTTHTTHEEENNDESSGKSCSRTSGLPVSVIYYKYPLKSAQLHLIAVQKR